MQVQNRAGVEGRPMVDRVDAGVRIKETHPGGIAEAVGMRPGDVILAVNGQPVRDPIDYQFHTTEEEIEISVQRRGAAYIVEVEKDADDDLGLSLEDMPILKCDNKCVFCFLHQMPKGLRKTLYYQDDDYRLSFLHGAYVTLTNLSEEEFQRIIDQRLSPMYISVHATDPAVRAQLLGRSGDVDVMGRIRFLAQHGIRMHAQIVLCPGINDGPHLKRTVFDLAACYPDVESVGVVPLGLTRYRKNLPQLDPVTPSVAAECVNSVSDWQRRFRKRLGINFVYLGDEFYLQAGRDIPTQEAYDGFPLLENGVGMVRRFIDAFDAGIGRLEVHGPSALRATLVTSVLGAGFLQPMVDRLNRLPGMALRLLVVRNRFLGEGITVSGLLSGGDIRDALRTLPDPGDVVLLPPNCISHAGLFLDDLTPEGLAQDLGTDVVIGTYDLVETLENVIAGREPSAVAGAQDAMAHPYISSHQVDS